MSYVSMSSNLESAGNQIKLATNNISSGDVNTAMLNLGEATKLLKGTGSASPDLIKKLKNAQETLKANKASGKDNSFIKSILDELNRAYAKINNKKDKLNEAESQNNNLISELVNRIGQLVPDNKPPILSNPNLIGIIASAGASTDPGIRLVPDEDIDKYNDFVGEHGGTCHISLEGFLKAFRNNGVGNYTDEEKSEMYRHYCAIWIYGDPERVSKEEFDEYFTTDGFMRNWEDHLAHFDDAYQMADEKDDERGKEIILAEYNKVAGYSGYRNWVIDEFDLDGKKPEAAWSAAPPPKWYEQVGALLYNTLDAAGTGLFHAGETLLDGTVSIVADATVGVVDFYGAITGTDVSDITEGIEERVAGFVETDHTEDLKEERKQQPNARWAERNAPDWAKQDSDVMTIVEGFGNVAGTAAAAAVGGWGTVGAITGFGEGTEKSLQLDRALNGGEHSDGYYWKAQAYGAGSAAYSLARYKTMGATGSLTPTDNLFANAAIRVGINTGAATIRTPYTAALDTVIHGVDYTKAFELEGGTDAMVTDAATTAVFSIAMEGARAIAVNKYNKTLEKMQKEAIKAECEKYGIKLTPEQEAKIDNIKLKVLSPKSYAKTCALYGKPDSVLSFYDKNLNAVFTQRDEFGKILNLHIFNHEYDHGLINFRQTYRMDSGYVIQPGGMNEAMTEFVAQDIVANGLMPDDPFSTRYQPTVLALKDMSEVLDHVGLDGTKTILEWGINGDAGAMVEVLDGIAGEDYAREVARSMLIINKARDLTKADYLKEITNLEGLIEKLKEAAGLE